MHIPGSSKEGGLNNRGGGLLLGMFIQPRASPVFYEGKLRLRAGKGFAQRQRPQVSCGQDTGLISRCLLPSRHYLPCQLLAHAVPWPEWGESSTWRCCGERVGGQHCTVLSCCDRTFSGSPSSQSCSFPAFVTAFPPPSPSL